MKKIITILSITIIIILTYNHNRLKTTTKEIKIRLLQTTDIHAHYLKKKSALGGWLTIAQLIKEARQENPLNLLIDCGDTIQGSAIATYEKGELAIELLNYLKYDAWILGNHELDFGLTHLNKLISQTKIPIICGNFSFKKNLFPAWKIYHKQGVKIAIIGLQVAYLKHWFIGKDYQDFEETKGYQTVKKSLQELQVHKPDIIIVAAHQGCVNDWRGVNEVFAICQDFPQINIFLGGHTHRPIAGKKVNQTYYMQAGYHANHLGVLDLSYNKQTKKITSIQSHLRQTDSTTNYDDQAYQQIKNKLLPLHHQTTKPLFLLKKKLTAKKLAQRTAKAIISATDAQFSLQRPIQHTLPKGNINLQQLFSIFPYENRIFTIEITFSQLKTIFQEQQKTFGRQIQQLWTNKQLIITLQPFQGRQKLALNSYTTAGAGRYPQLVKIIQSKQSNLKEYPFIIRNIVKDYLLKQQGL